jgi:putative membrane protein
MNGNLTRRSRYDDDIVIPALASALHILGIALVCTFSTLRLFALRRKDVPATRLADNGNGIGSIFLFGAGLWRLFAELEKPLGFYTENWVFWAKMIALGVMVSLEMYPQYVVLPWHFRHARKQPIEPKPGQFERMFKVCALQLPCIVVVIFCAALMARGVGLPEVKAPAAAAATSNMPGAQVYATYCQTCHQADGRAMGGKLAGDFVGNPAILGKSDAELLGVIARGKTGAIGAMPGWGAMLSEQQQRDVLAYIRATFGAGAGASAPRK